MAWRRVDTWLELVNVDECHTIAWLGWNMLILALPENNKSDPPRSWDEVISKKKAADTNLSSIQYTVPKALEI